MVELSPVPGKNPKMRCVYFWITRLFLSRVNPSRVIPIFPEKNTHRSGLQNTLAICFCKVGISRLLSLSRVILITQDINLCKRDKSTQENWVELSPLHRKKIRTNYSFRHFHHFSSFLPFLVIYYKIHRK